MAFCLFCCLCLSLSSFSQVKKISNIMKILSSCDDISFHILLLKRNTYIIVLPSLPLFEIVFLSFQANNCIPEVTGSCLQCIGIHAFINKTILHCIVVLQLSSKNTQISVQQYWPAINKIWIWRLVFRDKLPLTVSNYLYYVR